jgi:hypothetical protein
MTSIPDAFHQKLQLGTHSGFLRHLMQLFVRATGNIPRFGDAQGLPLPAVDELSRILRQRLIGICLIRGKLLIARCGDGLDNRDGGRRPEENWTGLLGKESNDGGEDTQLARPRLAIRRNLAQIALAQP